MPYISQPNPPRLDHAAAPGRYLAATCDCGDEQPLDARPWLDQGQGWRRLTELETRLRCLCGARSVRLAIRDGEPPAIASVRILSSAEQWAARAPTTMSGPLSPYSALTVAEMIVRGWKVRGHCAQCGTTLAISLDALARANGTDLILWGRTVPCPKIHENKWRCEGRLDYLAQQISGGSWGRLKPISDRDIATIRASRGNHSRQYIKDRDSPADG